MASTVMSSYLETSHACALGSEGGNPANVTELLYYCILCDLPAPTLSHLRVKALCPFWPILRTRARAWNSPIFTAASAFCEARFEFRLQTVFCLRVNWTSLDSFSFPSRGFRCSNNHLQTNGSCGVCHWEEASVLVWFFFHEGVNPGELLVEMNNGEENTTGIKAADRYLFIFFYWLWKSKSLQSNDCGKRRDILI